MSMKNIIFVGLTLLLLLVAGCATEQVSEEFIDTELQFEPSTPTVVDQPSAPSERAATQIDTRSEWEIFREYVTDEYPISTEYFDKHFVFDSAERDVAIRSDTYDPVRREFPVVLEGATLVRYHLLLRDEAGVEYVVRDYLEGVYLMNGEVIDNRNSKWLEGVDLSLVQHKTYEKLGPTTELTVIKDKQEAIKAAKWIVECTNKNNFDTWEARENLEINWIDGKLVWNWESKGNACLVNAAIEGSEVEVMVV